MDGNSNTKKTQFSSSRRRRHPPPIINMESRSKKARIHNGSNDVAKRRRRIPDDIVYFNILPRLSFKSLSRFKNVCKAWHDLITDEGFFGVEQSRNPSPTSSGFVYLSSAGLVFLSSDDTPIGVPDPTLSTLRSHLFRLVASTNGLLCFYVHALYFNFLCVLNPATQEDQLIPQSKDRRHGVGLAFDPSISPTRYALVYPKRRHVEGSADGELLYRFDVFSSCTGKWVMSERKVTIRGFRWRHQNPVFAGGVLYWDCTEYSIWFDPCRDLAGWMTLPTVAARRERHAIGASEGGAICMVISEHAVDIFALKDGDGGSKEWSRRHRVCLERIVERNHHVFAEFCNTMNLRRRSLLDRLFSRWFIQPLAFEGGHKLYLWVRVGIGRKEKERVLCHDLRTGETTLISNNVCFAPGEDQIFTYHNSMVRLPAWFK